MQTVLALIAVARTAAEALCLCGIATVLALTALAAQADAGLRLEQVGTEKVYFAYDGKPLFSFGGLSDFTFYVTRDAYDYVRWADWAKAHSINHVRAYPPLSWKRMEHFVHENGGSVEKLLFPYAETTPGSRQFDLTKFNDAYWRHFRQQLEYFQAKGIVVHLLMWNGWQLKASDDWWSRVELLFEELLWNGEPQRGGDRSDMDWAGHFFNPSNNVNAFTDHLGGSPENRFRIYHAVADHQESLVQAQKAWFAKLMETTAGLDNVYYDLVHEIAEHHRDWDKTRRWVEAMAKTVRTEGARQSPERPVILGMDTGGLSDAQRDWIFTRPYFDLLIFGKRHTVENAIAWRIKYQKPYVPQESWDDNGVKWSYRSPNHRVHLRKYFWKFMMAKSQQLDAYIKPRSPSQAKDAVNPPGYPHNYNPDGWNKFEDDAVILARFWDSLRDYPDLWFNGRVESGPGAHRYVLSSKEEAVAYCSSPTSQKGVKFEATTLTLKGLSLDNGTYTVKIIKPDRGEVARQRITVKAGNASVALPAFVDDLAIHFVRG